MYKRTFYFMSYSFSVRGATLIELMLTLTLSLVLLGLLATIYLGTQQQNELQSALLALHDNSRFTLQRLSSELRLAGFIGCPRLMPGFPLNNTTTYSFDSKNTLELQQSVAGSTVVTVRHRGLRVNRLQAPMTQASILELSSEFQVSRGDILLISDCKHADVFKVAQVTTHAGWQKLTSLVPLRYSYLENAEIGRLEINTYSVEKSERKDETGQSISALYVRDLLGRKTELVEGVQKMMVEALQPDKGKKSLGISIELEAKQKNLTKTEYAFVALRA